MCEGIDASNRWLHAMPAAGIPIMHMIHNLYHAAATVIVGPWNAERALLLNGTRADHEHGAGADHVCRFR